MLITSLYPRFTETDLATAEQLKALIRSHTSGDDDRFLSIAMQIAAHSAKKGNTQLAQELRSLIDSASRAKSPASLPRAVPIARPPSELSGLVTASFPNTRLADMVLPERLARRLTEVVKQYHHRDRLREHALSPKRKLLLVGPPGCGKTMTASALASECQLPLMFVQLHGLITKYMGETAAKLHLVFDAMMETRGVYLFDEFDAIGTARGAGNDVGEVRRILNSFLQFLERDDSDSIVVAATNFVGMLDEALFRRFDDVIEYDHPSAKMIETLIKNRLSSLDVSKISWRSVTDAARGLSHADIARACDDAAKDAILSDSKTVAPNTLKRHLVARQRMHRARSSRKPS